MDGRERKIEQAEDALFAYMMATVLEIQGEEIERLPKKMEPIPEHIDKAAVLTIQKAFLQTARKKRNMHVKKYLPIVFSSLIIIALLFTILYNTVLPVRVWTLNALIPIRKMAESIFAPTPAAPPLSEQEDIVLRGYKVPAVPAEFVLTGIVQKDAWEYASYSDGADKQITFFVQTADGGLASIDTENAEVTPIDIHGCQGTIIEKEYGSEGHVNSSVIVICPDAEQALFVSVEAINLERDTVVELAQQLVYIGTEE